MLNITASRIYEVQKKSFRMLIRDKLNNFVNKKKLSSEVS